MAFPSTIDAPATPGTTLASNPHSSLHTATNTSIVAIETKLGVDSSAVTSTIDYKLKSASSLNPGHLHNASGLSATGVASSSTFYRGDSAWASNIKFGGTGADGALSSTSGTTTIDCGSLRQVVKNYTFISLTGTANIAFSNIHAEGTIIYLRSQGNVTLTSGAARLIDGRSAGGDGGTGGGGSANTDISVGIDGHGIAGGGGAFQFGTVANGGGGGGGGGSNVQGTIGTKGGSATSFNNIPGQGGYAVPNPIVSSLIVHPGGGGGGGAGGNGAGSIGGAGGAGGKGGGGLIIECAGAYNFTGTIDVSGAVGTAGTNNVTANGGGGGGGGGGNVLVIYTTLTTDSGTYTVSGGTGGAAGAGAGVAAGAGGAGASGIALRVANTVYA